MYKWVMQSAARKCTIVKRNARRARGVERRERELHPEIEEGEEIDDDRVFLVDSFARDADLGVNDQVSAMFEDALRRDGGRKKALLLDITQAKVYVPTGVFDKAEKMQNDFPALHVLVYCGRGIVVRFSRTATQNAALADVKSTVAPGSGRVILPPRWSSSIPRPQSGGRESCAWRTDAKQMWGKAGNGFDDKGTTIGPGHLLSAGLRTGVARIEEVLAAVESVLELTRGENRDHADDAMAVFGYTMMARGNSFVTDSRVPTHLVLAMKPGASIDLLVQTAGRATFLRRSISEENGWVEGQTGVVRVLMPELDYRVVQAYPGLVHEVNEHLLEGTSINEIFSPDTTLLEEKVRNDLGLAALASSKRIFGDRRKRYGKAFLGHDADESVQHSIDADLRRLDLPKKQDTIWFDGGAHGGKKWFETQVVDVRYDPTWDREGDVTSDHIEYKLRCCDRTIPDFNDGHWLLLAGGQWCWHDSDIPRGHDKHVPQPDRSSGDDAQGATPKPGPSAQGMAQALEASEGRSQEADTRNLAQGIEESLRAPRSRTRPSRRPPPNASDTVDEQSSGSSAAPSRRRTRSTDSPVPQHNRRRSDDPLDVADVAITILQMQTIFELRPGGTKLTNLLRACGAVSRGTLDELKAACEDACRNGRLRSRRFQQLTKGDLKWLVNQALGGDDENDDLSVAELAHKFVEYLRD